MKIKNLTPNPKNPRTITDAKLGQLKKALNAFGDLGGFVFNRKSGNLVGGHQRQKIMDPEAVITISKKYSKPTKTGTVAEGYVELEGERFSYREVFWKPTKEKAANIAANKGAGEWDLPILGEWMKEISLDTAFDLDLTMFDETEFKGLGNTVTVSEHSRTGKTGVDEDAIPEKVQTVTEPGDIYLLGNHRLLCGDSTKIQDVEKLLDGATPEMVFTDPPYNQTATGGKTGIVGKASAKLNATIAHMCDFEPEKFLEVLLGVFKKDNMNALIFCNKDLVVNYLKWARDNDLAYNILVWKKPTAIPIGSSYRPDVEYLLSFRKSSIWNTNLDGVNYSKVLEHGREAEKVHPTMKPVALIENQLQITSNANSIVLDFFGGSGSTLIACEKLGRKGFMMEMDPHYCDVIVARWEKYTGFKATLKRSKVQTKKVNGHGKAKESHV